MIAAALSIQDPRERPADQEQAAAEHHHRFADPESDFLGFLNLWRYLREQQKARGSSQFRRMCKAEHLHHLRIREWQDVHSQLRQVARGHAASRSGRWPRSPTATASTARCWPACSRTSGCSTPTATSTAGAREARFVIAPGSALGQAPPEVGHGGRAGGDQPAPGPHGRRRSRRIASSRRPATSSRAATGSRGGRRHAARP